MNMISLVQKTKRAIDPPEIVSWFASCPRICRILSTCPHSCGSWFWPVQTPSFSMPWSVSWLQWMEMWVNQSVFLAYHGCHHVNLGPTAPQPVCVCKTTQLTWTTQAIFSRVMQTLTASMDTWKDWSCLFWERTRSPCTTRKVSWMHRTKLWRMLVSSCFTWGLLQKESNCCSWCTKRSCKH